MPSLSGSSSPLNRANPDLRSPTRHNPALGITLISPAVVLGGEPRDQSSDLDADWLPSPSGGVGPLAGDQAAVPAQDGAGGDQPVHPQPCRQEPDQRGEDRAVGPVEPGPRIGTATSCRSTRSSASLEADDRPSRTSQPPSRTKMK